MRLPAKLLGGFRWWMVPALAVVIGAALFALTAFRNGTTSGYAAF